MYNWQHKNWPDFKFDSSAMERQLMAFMLKAGELKGKLSALPKNISTEMIIQIMVSEAVKTSAIEGEIVSRRDVMSSIKKNLGLHHTHETMDKNIIGLTKMLMDVRDSFAEPLTSVKLKQWHQLLMSNNKNVHAGDWRKHKAPMQIISGSVVNPTIHFEAPPSKDVPKEMNRFIHWYNNTDSEHREDRRLTAAPIKAAIAHLYFESIHPFEDGNGRIGRAIAEKALSQGINSPVIFSISKIIEAKRKEYYQALQRAQQSLEITDWIQWFLNMILDAQLSAEKMIQFTVKKTQFFDQYEASLNERQIKVINRMLEEAPEKFQGGMNATKYIGITGTSKATATRDLQQLVEKNIFVVIAAGRSTRYEINL